MGSLQVPTNHAHPAALLPRRDERLPVGEIPDLEPRFRLSTLFFALTSSAVCLGVARAIPALAICLVFVMAIAMIRVMYGIQAYADRGQRLGFLDELRMYATSLFVVIAIGGFVVSAFAFTLGACVGTGLLIAASSEGRQTEWVFGSFITGWIVGLVAAFFTGGWIAQMLWFAHLSPPPTTPSAL